MLFRSMAERDNVCKQIHMPLQAGNSRVLKKMNRTYTKEAFLALVDTIRDIMPNVNLSTDIIVGFPTETAEEFEDTLDVVRKVAFDTAFMFKYSERPNTTASRRFPDDVSDADKKTRIMALNELQSSISLKKNEAHVGTIQKVLVEESLSKKSDIKTVARNDGNTLVIIPDLQEPLGTLMDVKIVSASPHALRAEKL